jgi:hypothetical protein
MLVVVRACVSLLMLVVVRASSPCSGTGTETFAVVSMKTRGRARGETHTFGGPARVITERAPRGRAAPAVMSIAPSCTVAPSSESSRHSLVRKGRKTNSDSSSFEVWSGVNNGDIWQKVRFQFSKGKISIFTKFLEKRPKFMASSRRYPDDARKGTCGPVPGGA